MLELLAADETLVALFPLPGKTIYSVGRKACDLTLSSDKSISKKHAEFEFRQRGLWLRDAGSKFGTQLNGTKIEGVPCEVKDGDAIILGASVFAVRVRSISLCASGMVPSAVEALRASSAQFGAAVHREWRPDVSHLAMDSIKLTPKLLHAVAHCCPVVTAAWVEQCAARTVLSQPLPDPNSSAFQPPHDAAATKLPVHTHRVDLERKRLFAGKRSRLPSESATLIHLDSSQDHTSWCNPLQSAT